MIFEDGSLKSQPSLAATLDATVANSFTTPLPVYDWGGSSFFTGLTSPVDFAKSSWIVDGDYLQPTGAGTAVAGFRGTTTTNRAAVVVGNAGRTILDGFLFDDGVDATTIVQFAENEILSLYGAPTRSLAHHGDFRQRRMDGQHYGIAGHQLHVSADRRRQRTRRRQQRLCRRRDRRLLRLPKRHGRQQSDRLQRLIQDRQRRLDAVRRQQLHRRHNGLQGTLIITSSSALPTKGVLTVAGGGSVVTMVTPASSSVATNSASGTQPLDQVATVDELLLSTAFKPSSPAALTAGSQPLASSVASPAGPRCGVCVGRVVVVAGDFQRTAAPMIGPTRGAAPAPTTLDDLLATFNWPLG